MFHGTYRFAEVTVQIDSLYPLIHDMSRDYSCGGSPDIIAAVTQADIDHERVRSSISGCSDAYLETLAVYRKIAEKMPAFDVLLYHASAVAVDGAAYLFAAPSGTGKSTHARLWRELLGSRAVMVNDDKPLIRVQSDGTAIVYGTPWNGKHHLSSNIAVPIKAVCLLERSPDNHIRQISRWDALLILVQQAYRPAQPEAMEKTLALICRMQADYYALGCNMDLSAAELAYSTMKKAGPAAE